ncbi:Serine/threonine-protein kinase TAO3 [Thalictrum thalictroides]|uniref:Serine/threonine-protein kinase TAO3 n=1 Tax=Thalictrum thalictroides TaxID=46969 RepID=A0A7J6VCN0_THATH|nr:Serine/threonine-protein kinase TAO3 [Thalictrum thalictroides]
MGNCQAIDAASLVIQHPSGRVERFYWPISANEVMKSNPNHYVAFIITSSCLAEGDKNVANANANGVRVTRVKLLKPTDLLVLGQAYRLINSEEVMKGLWAKKYAKMKKKEMESSNEMKTKEVHTPVCTREATTSEVEVNQETMQDRNRHKRTLSAPTRGRQWRPSLQSISEAGLALQSQKIGQPAHQSHTRNGQLQREVIPQSS